MDLGRIRLLLFDQLFVFPLHFGLLSSIILDFDVNLGQQVILMSLISGGNSQPLLFFLSEECLLEVVFVLTVFLDLISFGLFFSIILLELGVTILVHFVHQLDPGFLFGLPDLLFLHPLFLVLLLDQLGLKCIQGMCLRPPILEVEKELSRLFLLPFKFLLIELILHLLALDDGIDHPPVLIALSLQLLGLVELLLGIGLLKGSIELHLTMVLLDLTLAMALVVKTPLIIEHVALLLFGNLVLETGLLALLTLDREDLIPLLHFGHLSGLLLLLDKAFLLDLLFIKHCVDHLLFIFVLKVLLTFKHLNLSFLHGFDLVEVGFDFSELIGAFSELPFELFSDECLSLFFFFLF